MRHFFALAALCAAPALAALEYPKYFDHKDFVYEHYHEDRIVENGHFPPLPRPHIPPPRRPYEVEHAFKLTDKFVCEKLHFFAREADYIYELVKVIDCEDRSPKCWEPVRKAIYDLEWEQDLFDTKIDKSDLNKCFDCRQEGKIACCYREYAASIIRMLKLIKYKTEFLEGGTDKYILTAVNSLRASDYTFVYELVRRMHCEKFEKEIMEAQGAVDGSTPGSIRAAFAEFVFTPYITGNKFEGPVKPPGQDNPVEPPPKPPAPGHPHAPPPPPHHGGPPPPPHHGGPPPPPYHGPPRVQVCPNGVCPGNVIPH
ncbi:hypothetical protein B0I35DRAFT_409581 [Stachybotrys elegans]|uniref:Uncharacterized protein n=1 Tax=Stachybotrys elegans TaxID=80388 RepID=A0A8K0ST76_9HYPO|nr:hypothetical protein B0I35DRAFT_409581 [Stachybotrys elegans]